MRTARAQRHQGQRAALAVVVGAQQDEDVFQRDDDDQRPQDQRHDAEHDVPRGIRRPPLPPAAMHGLAQRVERAGADVAVNDADAADRQAPEAGMRRTLPSAPDSLPGGTAMLSVMGTVQREVAPAPGMLLHKPRAQRCITKARSSHEPARPRVLHCRGNWRQSPLFAMPRHEDDIRFRYCRERCVARRRCGVPR